jgi:hypothetical protein
MACSLAPDLPLGATGSVLVIRGCCVLGQGNLSAFVGRRATPTTDHRASATRIAMRYLAQGILDLKAAEGCRSR